MTHEKIFKRDDGTRIKITVTFWHDRSSGAIYNVFVEKCSPGKRKFVDVVDRNDYKYRKLNMPERADFVANQHLFFVTIQEIYDTKVELWKQLAP